MELKKIFKDYDPKELKCKRQILGLSCKDIADLTGSTRQAISHIERTNLKGPITILYGLAIDQLWAEFAKKPEAKMYVEIIKELQ
jgi:predicted transcriptional regulator